MHHVRLFWRNAHLTITVVDGGTPRVHAENVVMIAVRSKVMIESHVRWHVWHLRRGRLGVRRTLVAVEHGPVVPGTATRGAEIVGGVQSRIGSRRRRVVRAARAPWLLKVCRPETGQLIMHARARVPTVRMRVQRFATVLLNIGVDGRQRGKTLESRLALLVLRLAPLVPAVEPGIVALVGVEVDIHVPVDDGQPLVFELVQLGHGDAADLGPGAVLKGIVVEELATQKETRRQEAPRNASVDGFEVGVDKGQTRPLGQEVESQKDRCAGKTGGREETRDKLAKRRSDGHVGHEHTLRHFGHIVRHLVDLIVEHRTDATGKHDENRDGDAVRVDVQERLSS